MSHRWSPLFSLLENHPLLRGLHVQTCLLGTYRHRPRPTSRPTDVHTHPPHPSRPMAALLQAESSPRAGTERLGLYLREPDRTRRTKQGHRGSRDSIKGVRGTRLVLHRKKKMEPEGQIIKKGRNILLVKHWTNNPKSTNNNIPTFRQTPTKRISNIFKDCSTSG